MLPKSLDDLLLPFFWFLFCSAASLSLSLSLLLYLTNPKRNIICIFIERVTTGMGLLVQVSIHRNKKNRYLLLLLFYYTGNRYLFLIPRFSPYLPSNSPNCIPLALRPTTTIASESGLSSKWYINILKRVP